jgi:hypothetical protein
MRLMLRRLLHVRGGVLGLAVVTILVASSEVTEAQTSGGLTQLDEGDRVWVTTTSGVETEGRVAGTPTATSLELNVGGVPRTLRLDEIRRIEGRDSIKNGAIVGAVVGGAAMALLAAWAIDLSDEGQGVAREDIVRAITMSSVAAAGGALAGAGIDRAIDGRRLLYVAPAARAGLRVRPMLSPASSGVRLTLNW